MDPTSRPFKVVLLGEGAVGKTSLVTQYCKSTFVDKHVQTLQASFLTKKLNIGGRRVDLAIWDTAGQERFHALGPLYYRDSQGAVLVYDITDMDSFAKVQRWVAELRRALDHDVCLAICGNKIDLEKNRTVDHAAAERYAQSVGAKHYLTSAKLNRGVDEVFLDLSKRMMAARDSKSSGGASDLRRPTTVAVLPDTPDQKGGCC